MIEIMLNGEKTTLEKEMSLSEFLRMQNYIPHSFAVAIDNTFVPRSQYEQVMIKASTRIEVLSPMQGG